MRQYRTIGPLITKVEEVVCKSNSGKNPTLRNYYYFWEKQFFDALVEMVLSNLKKFRNFLIQHPEVGRHQID